VARLSGISEKYQAPAAALSNTARACTSVLCLSEQWYGGAGADMATSRGGALFLRMETAAAGMATNIA